MKKRIASLLLCMCMTIGVLSGCGTVKVDATDDEVKASTSSDQTVINDTPVSSAAESVAESSSAASEEVSVPVDENTIYSITDLNLVMPKVSFGIAIDRGYEYENLHDFFTLLLKDYCEWMTSGLEQDAYGVVNARPYCIENMKNHGTKAFIEAGQALVVAAPALIIVGDYNEDNFVYALNETTNPGHGCGYELYYGSDLSKAAFDSGRTGTSVSYSYGCELVKLDSNIDSSFVYYAGTDATLQLLVKVKYTVECNGNTGTSEMTYAIEMKNNADVPEQWLISGIYLAEDNGDGTYKIKNIKMGLDRDGKVGYGEDLYVENFDVNNKLVNENQAEKDAAEAEKVSNIVNQVSEEEVQEALNAYSQFDFNGWVAIFDCGDSGIPYCADFSGIYHYENGEVCLVAEWSEHDVNTEVSFYTKEGSPYIILYEWFRDAGNFCIGVYEIVGNELAYYDRTNDVLMSVLENAEIMEKIYAELGDKELIFASYNNVEWLIEEIVERDYKGDYEVLSDSEIYDKILMEVEEKVIRDDELLNMSLGINLAEYKRAHFHDARLLGFSDVIDEYMSNR